MPLFGAQMFVNTCTMQIYCDSFLFRKVTVAPMARRVDVSSVIRLLNSHILLCSVRFNFVFDLGPNFS